MEFPGFFAEAPTISLRDPLAGFLGASKGGMITYCYADAVKLAGHSCPTVAGAYLMVRRGLRHLYGDEVPERGALEAHLRGVRDRGTTGVVAAVVWDHLGGMSGMRMMIDTVAALSEGGRQLRNRYCFQPMMRPGEMKRTFVEQGLADVTETELMIHMDYRNFDDYWAPIAAGEGPLGKYMTTLDKGEHARMTAAVRDAYEAGQPDGPRSFANVAWACRGVAP